MHSIMGGSTKENGLESDTDQGWLTWKEDISDTNRVPKT